MTFGLQIKWIFLLTIGTSVSSRVVEQWPIIPEEKPGPEYFYNFENVDRNNREWDGFFAFEHDVKPVKEVQTIIVTKKVPVAYPTDNFIGYSSQKNFPFPVGVEKEASFPIKKIIPIPVGHRPPYPVTSQHLPSLSYSIKYVKVPVTHSVPHPLPHTVHVEQKVPVSYPIESSVHREVPYPFPFHLNVPVDKPEPEETKKVSETIFVEKGAPHFSIYLLPFPVEKSPLQGTQAHETHEKEQPESHIKPGYFTSLKPQDARSPLYSVTHKLYNSLKKDQRPPQVVDYNHPIDHDEE